MSAATKFKVTWRPVGASNGEQKKGEHTYSCQRLMSVAMEDTFPKSLSTAWSRKEISLLRNNLQPAPIADRSFSLCVRALLFMKLIPKALELQCSKERLFPLKGMPPASLMSYKKHPFFYRKTGGQDSVPGQQVVGSPD